MSKDEHLRLLEKYKAYANTEESRAVVFIKEHLNEESTGHWIDIEDCEFCNHYESDDDWSKHKFHFELVKGGFYKRKLKPKYPPKSNFTYDGEFDEDSYYLAVRAITWETAHRDIEQQKGQKIKPIKRFKVEGELSKKERKNFRYSNPEFVYNIKHIELS